MKHILGCFVLAVAGSWAVAQVSTPQTIKVQGFLNQSGSAANGTFTMSFTLYDAQFPGGAVVATAGPQNVTVSNGLYEVDLPFASSAFSASSRYLEITVNGETLTPRMQMVSAPFAYQAEKLDGFDGADFVKKAGDTMTGNLQVSGTVYSSTGGFRFPDGTTQTTAATQASVGNTLDQAYNQGGPGAGRAINATAGPVAIQGPDGLNVSGNLLVGTSTAHPGYRLIVQGGDARVIDPGNSTTIILGDNDTTGKTYVRLGTSADSQGHAELQAGVTNTRWGDLILNPNGGNIGIGTASPGSKLDIAGTARTTVLEITSDRNMKTQLEPVDTRDVLAKVLTLPISSWSYKNDPGIRHIGPMSQDFAAAFAVGEDDKHIATVDADGVAISAVQGVNQKLEDELRRRDERIAGVEERLTVFESKSNTGGANLVDATSQPSAREDSQPTTVHVSSAVAAVTTCTALSFPDGTCQTTAYTGGSVAGVTLDQAYDLGGAGAGATITADAGAVNVAGPDGLTVNGKVGIGTTSPGSKLTVAGVIESTSGGIKFPDGTTQTTATPHTFAACVNFSGTACTTIYCSCGTATQITQVQSDCTVTSETGSCSAYSFSCVGGGIGHGTCCVCQP